MEMPPEKTNNPKHIDREELYTDFQTRVNYLKYFLDFNKTDIAALKDGSKLIKSIAPAVAHKIYEKLLKQDITARAFHNRSTRQEEDTGEYYNIDSPAILRRKMFLRWYMTRLCGDPTKIEFWMFLDKIAMMHSGRGRLHALDIEYVHIGATLGFIQDIVLEAVMKHPTMPQPLQLALLRALTKVIWIQNDFFARWRVREGQEFLDRMEPVKPPKDEEQSQEEPDGSTRSTGTATPTSAHTPISPLRGTSVFSEEGLDKISIKSSETWKSIPSTTKDSICPFAAAAGKTYETKIWSESASTRSGAPRKISKS